ncbi:hypothetical protein C8J56DRAFT_849783 [Mycena floridula]|nr:hypothetical protein C8J56DRAFT_849783 [Mycena floridula]
MSKSLVTELCDGCSTKFVSREFIFPNSLETLRSGRFLTDVEAKSIRFQLPIAADELSRYDTRITQLRFTIDKLELERDNLHGSIKHGRALIAPIRRLPTEILTNIFEWCLEPNPDDCHESDFPFANDFTEPETLQISILTAVCTVWRDVAIATGRFWSKLAVNTGSCTEGTARLVGLHGRRSNGLPLSLRIHHMRPSSSNDDHRICFSPPRGGMLMPQRCCFEGFEDQRCRFAPTDPCFPACDRVMEILLVPASRISSLVIYIYNSGLPIFNYNNPIDWDGSFPTLEALEIRMDAHISTFDEGWSPAYSMPKLHTLTLEYVPINSERPEYIMSMGIPFQQITTLDMTNIFFENIIRTIQCCPQLQHLQVAFQFIREDIWPRTPYPKQFIPHRLLETLHITILQRPDPDAYPLFLKALTLPCLHSISLTGMVWPCPAFNSLVERSNCSIQKLSLHQIDLAEWSLSETLSLFPNLSRLHWSDPYLGDIKDQTAFNDFLRLISDNMLPRLTIIDLDLNLLSYGTLVELIRVRSAAFHHRPLHQIALTIRPEARYNAVVAELEVLRREGVNLNIRRSQMVEKMAKLCFK